MSNNYLTKFIEAFGVNAATGYINPIPNTTTEAGAASFDQGFPQITMEAPAAGGIPPYGQDFNGLLNQITAVLAYLNAGKLFVYDSAFATAIGGYQLGTLLQMTDGTGFWLNVGSATNTTNPETTASYGWVPVDSIGNIVISSAGGTVTLTPLQYRKTVICIAGTLTQNLTIVFPTGIVYEWLIYNNTTGAFTTTVKTAGGASVVIPQGGAASPTPVYSEGTGIYPATAPLAAPIDQNPDPLTIAERTSAGYLLATYMNQNSPLENPAVGAVFVENAGHDGFMRKISIANFIAALSLATVASAAAQAAAAQSAAEAYANGSSGTGWYKLPNGVIECYGTQANTSPGSPVGVTFPIPGGFPNGCQSITATANGVQGTVVTSLPSASKTGFTITNGASGSVTSWRAVGN